MKCFLLPIVPLFILAGCATDQPTNQPLDYSRTFRAKYESVWRATQTAMLDYPMNINNMDTGQLQTLYITGRNRFQAPHKEKETLPSGFQYRININLLKGDDMTKVIVQKEARLQKDFFSEPQDLISDGFEEKVILYRIKRELVLEKIMKKVADKKGKQTPATQNQQMNGIPPQNLKGF